MPKAKPVYKIEVMNAFYVYSIGYTYIAIASKPDGQYAELPAWMQVCFGVETPAIEYADNPFTPGEEMEGFVDKAIRAKIAEQKRNGKYPRNLPKPKPKKKKEKGKKE